MYSPGWLCFQPKHHQGETLSEDLDVELIAKHGRTGWGNDAASVLTVAAPALLLAWLLTPIAASTNADRNLHGCRSRDTRGGLSSSRRSATETGGTSETPAPPALNR